MTDFEIAKNKFMENGYAEEEAMKLASMMVTYVFDKDADMNIIDKLCEIDEEFVLSIEDVVNMFRNRRI
jgi:hypothetical protein